MFRLLAQDRRVLDGCDHAFLLIFVGEAVRDAFDPEGAGELMEASYERLLRSRICRSAFRHGQRDSPSSCVSFSIKKGGTVALVRQSGSGSR
jgi:hypothetical protein